MATYTPRRDPLVTCPFNPAHQVKSGRYQIHITKCKKSHPGIDIHHCPFSADHVVEPSKLMHHVYTCPLNTTVERFRTQSDKDVPVTEPVVADSSGDAAPVIEPEENWEEEVSEPSALETKLQQPAVRPIFTDVQSMAPAQRRKFYASLRQKATQPPSSDAEATKTKPEEAPEEPKAVTKSDEPVACTPVQPLAEPQFPQCQAPPQPFMLQDVIVCHSDWSDDEDGQQQVYYMGAGRGHPGHIFFTDLEVSDDEEEREIQARMKLLGIGRGRRIK
ncbi:uncharacterized protein LOC142571148 [Dermacentor variabilis]|uniref:uncharacterized protein LOC142571148 n=1 Tax=Dermacentor variabilis TaxID=34621 RepID=UPI003F5B0F2C